MINYLIYSRNKINKNNGKYLNMKKLKHIIIKFNMKDSKNPILKV